MKCKCITCGTEITNDVYCKEHVHILNNTIRFFRTITSIREPEFNGPHEAELTLSGDRRPTTLRRVVKWFEKSGYKKWSRISLRDETYKSLKVDVIANSDDVFVDVNWLATPLRSICYEIAGNLDYTDTGYRLRINWNNWQKIKRVIDDFYPIQVIDTKIKNWAPTARKKSSNPDTMRLVSDGKYTCELALNRGKIIGGEWVATENGIADFKNLFAGSSRQGSKSFGNFGRRFIAPATIENLETIIKLTVQPQDIKVEACSMIVEQTKRDTALAKTFPWRMHTDRYDKNKLHRYVYDIIEDDFFGGLIDTKEIVNETETWRDWLNIYEPYSQQKIVAAASVLAKYVGWWIDMRVGKTPTAMMLMRYLLDKNLVDHFVVVAPAINVYDPWFSELERQGCFRVCTLDEGSQIDEQSIRSEAYDIYVVSYSSLSARLPIMQWYWSMERVGWTFDETSLIKNPSSKRAKACRYATEHAPYVYALNGTPLAQGPQDIWSQQIVIDQGITFGTSFERFSTYWLKRAGTGKFIIDSDMSTLFELRLAGSSIRYLRSEADQFSGRDKNFRYIAMPPTGEIKESTKEILAGYTRDEQDNERGIKENILTIYGHLRECCASYNKYEVVEGSCDYNRVRHSMNPKVVWIRTFLKSNPGQPMIIFSENSEMEDWIMEMLDHERVSYSSLRKKGGSGTLSGHERMYQLKEFQEGRTRVILMKSVSAKGVTLNRIPAVKAGLGSYPVIIYTQPTWSLIDWEQSQDRAVGTDPKTKKSISTMVYVLVIRGSIEQQIVGALRKKKKVAETLLADAARTGYENPFESMDFSTDSEEELDEIFDSEEMEARYLLSLAPQKKLTERMIIKADIKYRANKYGTNQKTQEMRPLSRTAVYLLAKLEPEAEDAK